MLKRIFLSPFILPLLFLVLWGSFIWGACFMYADDLLQLTEDGECIDVIAKLGYIFLLYLLLFVYRDFSDKMLAWGMYIFLALVCFLRESGIQHHLSMTDSTPFKSRFFLNPNNFLFEKIIYGGFLLLIFWMLGYFAWKYGKSLIKGFLKFDTIAWSVAVLCCAGVGSKYIDRFPANYRRSHPGMSLDENVYAILQVVEEVTEMFLPYLAMFIILQYHLLKKKEVS
ncbi:MAG: hypothetical protein J6W96_03405 [Alphaproteobacteria bacterium]|nr:hypothetical protein [Alphaproteobacteria bacterium]